MHRPVSKNRRRPRSPAFLDAFPLIGNQSADIRTSGRDWLPTDTDKFSARREEIPRARPLGSVARKLEQHSREPA